MNNFIPQEYLLQSRTLDFSMLFFFVQFSNINPFSEASLAIGCTLIKSAKPLFQKSYPLLLAKVGDLFYIFYEASDKFASFLSGAAASSKSEFASTLNNVLYLDLISF